MTHDLAHQSLLQRLRRAGLRPTVPRILILQTFVQAEDEALPIEDMFRRTGLRGLHSRAHGGRAARWT